MIGVISVQSDEQEGRFTEADQRLLTTIATAVGVAFHNAKLFEEAGQARAAAEQADAAKSSFLSTVSHELRAPLTSVLGFAKIIRRRLEERLFPMISDEDRKVQQAKRQVIENLEIVVSEGERLTKLIDDVPRSGQDRGRQVHLEHDKRLRQRCDRARSCCDSIVVRGEETGARPRHRAGPSCDTR